MFELFIKAKYVLSQQYTHPVLHRDHIYESVSAECAHGDVSKYQLALTELDFIIFREKIPYSAAGLGEKQAKWEDPCLEIL